jgi:hypothetical protein
MRLMQIDNSFSGSLDFGGASFSDLAGADAQPLLLADAGSTMSGSPFSSSSFSGSASSGSSFSGSTMAGSGSTALSPLPTAARETDAIAQSRAEMTSFYAEAKDNAVRDGNPLKYIGSHIASLAGEVGYDAIQGVQGLYRLATDSSARQQAVDGVTHMVTHPRETFDAAVGGVKTFIDKPFSEQADSVFKGGLSLLAGGGVSKATNAVGSLAGPSLRSAGKAAVEWAAPAIDDFATSFMKNNGLLLQAMPDGPSFGSSLGPSLNPSFGSALTPDAPSLSGSFAPPSAPAIIHSRGDGFRPAEPGFGGTPLLPDAERPSFPILTVGSLRGGPHERLWWEEQVGLPHNLEPEWHGYIKPGIEGGLVGDELGKRAGQGYFDMSWREAQLNNNLLTQTGRRPEDFKLLATWAGGAEDALPLSARHDTPWVLIDNGPKVDFRKVIETWPHDYQMAPLHRSFEKPLDDGADFLTGEFTARFVRNMGGPFMPPALAHQMGEAARIGFTPLREHLIENTHDAFMKAHEPFYKKANLIYDSIATGDHQILYPEAFRSLQNVMNMPEHLDGLPIDHITIYDASLDQINRLLNRVVQPDGSVLNPTRELQAGRMSQGEFNDLMSFRAPNLNRFDEDVGGSFARSLGGQGVSYDALAQLRDQGVLRLPYGGGIDFLGRGPDDKLRSVLTMGNDLTSQRMSGLGTFRPVLPGDPREIAVVPNAMDALRLWSRDGAQGPTVIIDSVESGRWTSPLQGGQLLEQADRISLPAMRPGLFGPAGDAAQRARYDQMLDIAGRERVHIRDGR